MAQCQRLVKGYSDTHERGLRNYETLVAIVQRAGATLAPATLRELRDAALADERGDKLRATLAQHALAWTARTMAMAENLPTMTLRVAEARQLNPLIRQFKLRAPDNRPCPATPPDRICACACNWWAAPRTGDTTR